MKNKCALIPGLLAIAVMAAAAPSYAQDAQSRLTAGLPSEISMDIKRDQSHEITLDSMTREVEILQKKTELEQAKFNLEKVRLETEGLKAGVVPEAQEPIRGTPRMNPGNDSLIQAQQQIQASKAAAAAAKAASEAKEDASPLDNIYVTRIYGFGDRKEVTVYLNNSIFNLDVGEVFSEGVKLVSASDTEATFSHEGKKRSVSLTTQRQAYTRTFRSANQKSEMDDDVNQMGVPSFARPLDLL